jgi:hypothetical protein
MLGGRARAPGAVGTLSGQGSYQVGNLSGAGFVPEKALTSQMLYGGGRGRGGGGYQSPITAVCRPVSSLMMWSSSMWAMSVVGNIIFADAALAHVQRRQLPRLCLQSRLPRRETANRRLSPQRPGGTGWPTMLASRLPRLLGRAFYRAGGEGGSRGTVSRAVASAHNRSDNSAPTAHRRFTSIVVTVIKKQNRQNPVKRMWTGKTWQSEAPDSRGLPA